MNDTLRKKIRQLPFIYIILLIIHPLIYFLIIIYLTGLPSFLLIIKALILIALPLILLPGLLFLVLHQRLKSIIKRHWDSEFREISPKEVKFVNFYSFWGTLFLIAGSIGAPVVASLSGYANGAYVSVVNVIYNIIVGELLALAVCMFFYFFSKQLLYPFVEYFQFRPIKLLYRFLIMILSAIFLILSLVGSQIYKMSQIRIYDSFNSDTVQVLKKYKTFLDANLQGMVNELAAYSLYEEIIPLSAESAAEFYERKAGNPKNQLIEMYMISDSSGHTISNFGSDVNISGLEYFKKVMDTGNTYISEPVSSLISHQNVIVCSAPIIRGEKPVGLVSASILVDRLQNELNESGSRYVEFMMISNEGKIYIHRDYTLTGKVIGKDITDNGQYENVGRILSSPDFKVFTVLFQGKKRTAMKISMDSMSASIILMMDSSYLSGELDKTLLFVMTFIIVISLVIYLILWYITNGISKPIHNTVILFKKLAGGDLTVTSNDYSRDEFGELLRNFNMFLAKIKDVMNHALNSSQQLSVSADELSSTSVSLAYGAQQQAASVEEATSSLEEISASISSIADSSREQSNFADQTYNAMGNLRMKADEVTRNSEDAVDMAQKTIREAESGNRMMLDAIERMDNIDRSTAQIADVIGLIRDISDQVNLLSLNAAIEAARAGEHGRGFAIVAEEISKLADQTAQSTNTISKFVETGRTEVELGRNQVNATSGALKNILSFIANTERIVNLIIKSVQEQNEASLNVVADTKKVKEMADSISVSTEEQNITNEEMVNNVDIINQQTQSVAGAADKIAESAEEIAKQAALLRQQIEFFKV